MSRSHHWWRRVATATTAVVAGSVLVLGHPESGWAPAAAGGAVAVAATPAVELVATHPRRWPGHPGRRLLVHRVRRGETATGLAVRFHAWTAELVSLNHLGAAARLRVGQRLQIPVVVAAVRRHHRARHQHARGHPAHHRARHHAPRHHPANHRVHHPKPRHHRVHHPKPKHHPARHHRPRHHRPRHHRAARPWRHASASRAQVRRVVARTARRHGVDPLTALAISWQESGWQQRRISSAGAIGAMQVMPGTGRWISSVVDRRLNLYGLGDNATAGVTLFRLLRREAGWRRSIAAYYQGLGSIRQRGPYPSTRRYTRSVTAIHRRLRHGWDPS